MSEPLHDSQLVFGPIASRRFGRSLGVNNIPAKHCSYSCVYCQVGPTPLTEVARRPFYAVAEIAAAVEERVNACRALGESIDIISFVPSGEPTLDSQLGEELRAVRVHDIPVGVITNGSLLWMPEVRRDLESADIVSIEVDTVDELAWRRLDRPSKELSLQRVHDGMRAFARSYRGQLVTQTMLIGGLNDDQASLESIAEFVAELAPRRVCLSVPTRPPAEARVAAPQREAIARAQVIFTARMDCVELLTDTVQDVLVATGDAAGDLLAALAVHPMREKALLDDGVPAALIEQAIGSGQLVRVVHAGNVFLARRP